MRDDFQCRYCGVTGDDKLLEVDHIIPKSKGGLDDEENLVTACFDCNRGKRDRMIISIGKVSVSKQTKLAAAAYSAQVQLADQANLYIKYFNENKPHKYEITPHDKKKFVTIAKRFEPSIIFTAIDIALERYVGRIANNEDYAIAIERIGGICFNKSKKEA